MSRWYTLYRSFACVLVLLMHEGITQAPSVLETIEIKTDREVYVAGDKVGFAISARYDGEPAVSRVVHLSVVDNDGTANVHEAFKLEQGIATGFLALPERLPTGVYRIFAYTQWQLNGDHRFLPYRSISVINPEFPVTIRDSSAVTVFPVVGVLQKGESFQFGYHTDQDLIAWVLRESDTVTRLNLRASETLAQFPTGQAGNYELHMYDSTSLNQIRTVIFPLVENQTAHLRIENTDGRLGLRVFQPGPEYQLVILQQNNEWEWVDSYYDFNLKAIPNSIYYGLLIEKETEVIVSAVCFEHRSLPVTGKLAVKSGGKISIDMNADANYQLAMVDAAAITEQKALTFRSGQSLVGTRYQSYTGEDIAYLPELYGPLIRGRVKGSVPTTATLSLLHPDASPTIVVSSINKDRQFNFPVPQQLGKVRGVISTSDSTSTIEVTSLNPEFPPRENLLSFPSKDTARLQRIYQNHQIQYYYQADAFQTQPARSVPFYSTPDYRVDFKDYIDLPILEEYFLELATDVFIRSRDGFKYLDMLDEGSGKLEQALVLVNHVPVSHINSLLQIDPEKVDYMEVVSEDYFLGPARYPGIISIVLRDQQEEYYWTSSHKMVIQSISPESLYAPDTISSHTPYIGNTYEWTDLKTGVGAVTFKAPDQPGKYILEFIDKNADQGIKVDRRYVISVEDSIN